MANPRVVAPKSADYDVRSAQRARTLRISTLRGKASWTPAEQTELLKLLLDDYAARNPQP